MSVSIYIQHRYSIYLYIRKVHVAMSIVKVMIHWGDYGAISENQAGANDNF